ncbi:MAG: DUF4198 domain-containing protein, partial [Bacteroidota bacterium]
MRKIAFALACFFLLCSHDMFLKLEDFHLPSNAQASIHLYNGTFERSENVIDRNRMLDVSLVGNGVRTQVDSTQWSEKDSVTILNFTTGSEGTWVAGVSTRPRNIEMAAADFNGYLEHDGVLDMLNWRKENNALDQDAIEKYSKHVKTIFQVGNKKTDDWLTVLGYPIEFIPAINPYDLHAGDTFEALLLWQGESLANQLVYADFTATNHDHSRHGDGHEHDHHQAHDHQHDGKDGHSHEHDGDQGHHHDHNDDHKHDHSQASGHSHDHDDAHEHEHTEDHTHADHDSKEGEKNQHNHTTTIALRTNSDGIVSLPLTDAGHWYLRTIYLVPSEEEGLTHESNWATLTFGVSEGHSHSHDHAHNHSHDHEHDGHTHEHGDHTHEHVEDSPFGIPSYLYWIGSLLI